MKTIREQALKTGSECYPIPFDQGLQLLRHSTKKQMQNRKNNSSDQVNAQTPAPSVALETEATRNPKDQRRKDRPFVPITQCPIKRLSPTDRTSERGTRIVHLRRKKQPNKARYDENQ